MSSENCCPKCNKTFKSKSGLLSHLKKKIPCSNNTVDEQIDDLTNNLNNLNVNENNYSNLSVSITNKLSSTEKSENGIFFTPPITITKIFKKLFDEYLNETNNGIDNFKNILEPSCGSCEFIIKLNKRLNNINITGIEYNNKIYDEIKNINFNNNHNNIVDIINYNFLTWNTNKKYDLIIGNPPYFVINKNLVEKKYNKLFEGRPNIYIIFIIKSLELLNENGILAFVLPSNFINCLYYNKLREYIYQNFKIIDIIDCKEDKYLETQQDTIVLILQNTLQENKQNINNKKYILEINGYTIFNTENNIIKLKKLYENTTTINELNMDVSVGTVVWNEVKDKLKDDNKFTRLIYSSDIENKTLVIKEYKNNEKKNYIDKTGIKEPLLVLNRGYGKGKYNLEYCLINMDKEYLVENHLICIKSNVNLTKEVLLEKYDKIIKSFDDNRTREFINIYFGNSAINTTELKYILPIYLFNDICQAGLSIPL